MTRLIDADALKELIHSKSDSLADLWDTMGVLNAINTMPTVEKRPKGKWIKIFENPFTNGYVCPFCGHKIQVTEQFLPEVIECEVCGADMRGDEDVT